VVFFNKFLNYEPGSGPPIPGTTQIEVFESALSIGKVVRSEYKLIALDDPDPGQPLFRRENYLTDKVTIQRMKYCSPTAAIPDIYDPDNCITDENYVAGDYYPRTYLNPIDVVLVIDRSGSMFSEGKMGKAREAARMFVDLMRTGDKIGVVAFNSNATLVYPLTEIDPAGDVKEAAKTAINGLSASGSTSIGDGLQRGYQELEGGGESDPVRLMVLLSDGYENSPLFWDDEEVKEPIKADTVAVHTLGVGSSANQVLLARIANETGGDYQFADAAGLRQAFNSIQVKIYGEGVYRAASGIVPSGGTVDESVQVDSTIGSITFSLFWPGSDLDLALVEPGGRVITPTVAEGDPDISFTSGSTYEFYQVFAPQPGSWTMRIFGNSTPPEGEEYTISASGMDAMIFAVDPDQDQYYSGEAIVLTASIEESFLDSPTQPEYIYGVEMQVTAQDPALNTYTFDLYDDGLHGDGGADDGVYANTFDDTSLIGSYNFNVQVSGNNNRDGQPFTREYSFSTLVIEAPDWLIFADGFESGDLSAWSSSVTDGGDLSAAAPAALAGSYGMQALIDDTASIYVRDDTPDLESSYYARFEFDPNSITVSGGDASHAIFWVSYNAGPAAFKVGFGWVSGAYALQGGAFDESQGFRVSPMVTLSDAPHTIELYWQAASGAGADDGQFVFWVDGVEYANLTNLDNETYKVEYVRLGAVSGLDSGTSGSEYFDVFESRRQLPEGLLGDGAAMMKSSASEAVTGEEIEMMGIFLED